MLAAVTPFLLFAAFILLLLVSLSIPIIKSIDLLELRAHITEGISIASVTATGDVKFGVWGYCISAITASALGHSISQPAECSKARLGYTFDSTVQEALQVSGISNDLSKDLSTALVIHPIGAAINAYCIGISDLTTMQPVDWHSSPSSSLSA